MQRKASFQTTRSQFPLGLTSAVTIHKCQGLRLPENVTDMTHVKGKFKPGEAYVAFSRARKFEKLHIIKYTQSQIHMSDYVGKEMIRLRKNILPQMPSNLFNDVPGCVKLDHLHIRNFKRKIEDIKHDDIFKTSNIISLNETHLGHSDTLTSDMISISKDVLILLL